MSERIHYDKCPVCHSTAIRNVLQVTDHTVSQEQFAIAECDVCTVRFTQDIPGEKSISAYYQSEDYVSHSDTARGLVNKLYHRVRKRTIEKKRRLIATLTGRTNGRILDVGSGTGAFLQEMKRHKWDVTGLEPDAGARKVAREQYGLELSGMDIFYSLPVGSFHAITLWHVLEHVHDLHRYVEQLKALLTGDGKLFIAVPNYTSRDALVYGRNWAAYDVPRHLYHFSPQSMDRLMKEHELTISHHLPMWYDSFYISLVSSRYRNEARGKKGKTDWLSAGWNGLRSNLTAMKDHKHCSSIIYVINK